MTQMSCRHRSLR